MQDVSSLPPPVQKMLRGLPRKPPPADVALLQRATTQDMVKIYSYLSSGRSAESVWDDLRQSLVKRHGEPAAADGDDPSDHEDFPRPAPEANDGAEDTWENNLFRVKTEGPALMLGAPPAQPRGNRGDWQLAIAEPAPAAANRDKFVVELKYSGEPLGITCGALSETDAVVITDIERNTPAARAGLLAGHVVVKAGGRAIRKPRDLINQIKLIHGNGALAMAVVVLEDVDEPTADAAARRLKAGKKPKKTRKQTPPPSPPPTPPAEAEDAPPAGLEDVDAVEPGDVEVDEQREDGEDGEPAEPPTPAPESAEEEIVPSTEPDAHGGGGDGGGVVAGYNPLADKVLTVVPVGYADGKPRGPCAAKRTSLGSGSSVPPYGGPVVQMDQERGAASSKPSRRASIGSGAHSQPRRSPLGSPQPTHRIKSVDGEEELAEITFDDDDEGCEVAHFTNDLAAEDEVDDGTPTPPGASYSEGNPSPQPGGKDRAPADGFPPASLGPHTETAAAEDGEKEGGRGGGEEEDEEAAALARELAKKEKKRKKKLAKEQRLAAEAADPGPDAVEIFHDPLTGEPVQPKPKKDKKSKRHKDPARDDGGDEAAQRQTLPARRRRPSTPESEPFGDDAGGVDPLAAKPAQKAAESANNGPPGRKPGPRRRPSTPESEPFGDDADGFDPLAAKPAPNAASVAPTEAVVDDPSSSSPGKKAAAPTRRRRPSTPESEPFGDDADGSDPLAAKPAQKAAKRANAGAGDGGKPAPRRRPSTPESEPFGDDADGSDPLAAKPAKSAAKEAADNPPPDKKSAPRRRPSNPASEPFGDDAGGFDPLAAKPAAKATGNATAEGAVDPLSSPPGIRSRRPSTPSKSEASGDDARGLDPLAAKPAPRGHPPPPANTQAPQPSGERSAEAANDPLAPGRPRSADRPDPTSPGGTRSPPSPSSPAPGHTHSGGPGTAVGDTEEHPASPGTPASGSQTPARKKAGGRKPLRDVQSVHVTEWQKREGGVFMYKVVVAGAGFGVEAWRRYSVFDDLRRAASGLAKKLPTFPKKSFGTPSPKQLDERCALLDAFLSALVKEVLATLQTEPADVTLPLAVFLEVSLRVP
ncbi:hypothetical protein DIPPA_31691 [Diplonema papillatum]|nr:hypothetical protein DIPPA_31691 [Diplonema papillatum]